MPEIRSIPRTILRPACPKCSTPMNLAGIAPDEEGIQGTDSSSVRIAVIAKVRSSNRRGDVFRSEHFCSETVAPLVQFAHALHSLNRAYLKRKAS